MSTLLARLIAAGTPADLVAEVALELARAQAAQEAIERRRANDRERSTRRHVKSRDNTGDNVTQRDKPSLSRPPNENNSNPPTHTHPEITTPRARMGHRLPADWQPQPLTGDLGKAVAAWPAGAIERELARFRDWAASATGPNATKSDWQAAWRNWLRRAEDEGRYRNVRPLRPADDLASLRGSRPNAALDMVLQAERELEAEAECENPRADWPPRAALLPGQFG